MSYIMLYVLAPFAFKDTERECIYFIQYSMHREG